MPRRKHQFLEDDDSDSSEGSEAEVNLDNNDPDIRAERALFENSHKRRRKNGKEDAIYGVFGSDSEDEDHGGLGPKRKRSDWTKAPAFVAKGQVDLEKDMEAQEDEAGDGEGEEVVDEADGVDSSCDDIEQAEYAEDDEDEDGLSAPSSPRIRDQEEVEPPERPAFAGLGSTRAEPELSMQNFTRGGIGSSKGGFGSKGGIGSAKGGLGNSTRLGSATVGMGFTKGVLHLSLLSLSPAPTKLASTSELPTAFGGNSAPRAQRSFLRSGTSSTSKPSTPLPAHEQAHFNKIGSTLGAQMLAKMGWQAGTGLGATGDGIVIPIESKLRPRKMGIAFKGYREKTEQSKLEAKRRGEVVSNDEEEVRPGQKKKGNAKENRSDAWKKPKKVKTKVEHKTYEQIVAEAGQEPAASGIGQIIDATGRTPREVASLADISLSSWTPSTDPTRIPEVRHNLRLIEDACKNDLDGLAREAKALEERKRFIAQENIRLQKKVTDEAELITRLQQVKLVVDDIGAKAKELASVYEATLDDFSPLFSTLLVQYPTEFDRYRLDEIVVAAITPIVRRIVTQWNPLQDPSGLVATFRTWKQALKVNSVDKPPDTQIDIYGAHTVAISPAIEKPMTPFESLLWNVWLPKVRTCLNNEWSPECPTPAVKLYEAWSTFLPPFVRDNILDQLILPKVSKAVADWSPKRSTVSLHALVFPWLPYLGLRIDGVLGDAQRKVKSLLRSWVPADGALKDLDGWREVFDTGEWDAMLLKYVVPKLGSLLRDEFRINPRNQDMEPLKHVLVWATLLRGSVFVQLLETEFFPKWLDVLHIWLIQPKVSFEEVAQWYSFWKSSFPDGVQSMPGVARGFTRGLQLMNTAIELGPDAPTMLKRPDIRAEQAITNASMKKPTATKVAPARVQEITFRSIVEEFAASHNLLFIPTGRAHEKSRMPLFRVSSSIGGKGGLLVYVQDDAVWAPDGNEYRAITLEDMVLRANK
ncbi:GC-rich sequence DNA-binding factor-like protein-domain-containing protein [Suillus subaureus]|uniref:GC-rich sequence DNA-binding factor-like protein-domain-containing protein n=1 Tax=Suillus subaureus TaxID=48587 RepID=A0A9P7E148_9AGAM|nr:GC-rich sequence DNA-binding factor-like protein-domain-containing protein [Suillus subaureus]KAG1808637.1 GC-rich sequence DNA-binding factor-like protein-domain-containing protein [Suillus subaureus]